MIGTKQQTLWRRRRWPFWWNVVVVAGDMLAGGVVHPLNVHMLNRNISYQTRPLGGLVRGDAAKYLGTVLAFRGRLYFSASFVFKDKAQLLAA